MENWETFASKLIELMGFREKGVEVDSEERRGAIFIHDHPSLVREHLPILVESFNHLIQQVARKNNQQPVCFDINN